MRKMICLVAIVGLMGFLVGCEDPPPKTTTVDFPQAQAADSTEDQVLGDGVRIKFITAEGGHDKKQEEVQRQLEAFINSGRYEIVRVSTTRCNSSEAHLLSAEVYYRLKE